MSDEKMITEREAVEREREAFVYGLIYLDPSWQKLQEANDRTALLYPFPKRQRPLRVTFSDGSTWYREESGGFVHVRAPVSDKPVSVGVIGWHGSTAEDFRLMARMLDGELEDVPDGEDA